MMKDSRRVCDSVIGFVESVLSRIVGRVEKNETKIIHLSWEDGKGGEGGEMP